jgi:hypothetical protein
MVSRSMLGGVEHPIALFLWVNPLCARDIYIVPT